MTPQVKSKKLLLGDMCYVFELVGSVYVVLCVIILNGDRCNPE